MMRPQARVLAVAARAGRASRAMPVAASHSAHADTDAMRPQRRALHMRVDAAPRAPWPLILTTGASGGFLYTLFSQAAAEPAEQAGSAAPPPVGWYAYLTSFVGAGDGDVGVAFASGANATRTPGQAFGVAADAEPLRDLHVTLYQYQPCPFCNKVRAFLDYTNIPWTEIEVDPLLKTEIKWSTQYKKVPILTVGGEDGAPTQMNDSSEIMDSLLALLPDTANKPCVPDDAETAAKVTQWRDWVDNHLVHLLVANIYRTWDESTQAFDYVLTYGDFPPVQRQVSRFVGAAAMYGLSHYKLNKKYGIVEPREEMYQAVNDWVAALGDNDYLGQSEAPTMADISVFGVLRAIEGYPTFVDVMDNSNLAPWYGRMKQATGESSVLR